jgi:hypothetical protein
MNGFLPAARVPSINSTTRLASRCSLRAPNSGHTVDSAGVVWSGDEYHEGL